MHTHTFEKKKHKNLLLAFKLFINTYTHHILKQVGALITKKVKTPPPKTGNIEFELCSIGTCRITFRLD